MNTIWIQNKKIYVFILLVLIISVAATTSLIFLQKQKPQTQKVAHAGTALYFRPDNISVAAGQEFTLDILVDPFGHMVSVAEIYLSFNPSEVKLLEVKSNNIFPQELQAPKIDNTLGNCSIVQAKAFDNVAKTEEVVATLKFQALTDNADSKISFTEKSIVAGSDVPGVNLLKQTISTKISKLK